MGVFHPDLVGIQVRVLQRLGAEHAMVVYGRDGMDEVSLGAATMVGEFKDGAIREYEVHPEDFGLHDGEQPRAEGRDAGSSRWRCCSACSTNEAGPARDIVLLNAGAALYCRRTSRRVDGRRRRAGARGGAPRARRWPS